MSTAAPEMPRTKSVPAAALQFDGGRVEFAAAKDAKSGGNVPIQMQARSGQPIVHWYWGKVVHDMAGFSADQPTIPIDFRHDDGDALGFLNKFTPSNEGLLVAGELTPLKEDDRASTILKQSAAGVPYQASIFFRPTQLEEVMPGMTAEVNGYTVDGPAIIVRKWSLRGVAVCLYGADHRTKSQFSDGDEIAVPLFTSETSMSATSAPPAPAADKGGAPAADPKALSGGAGEAPKAGDKLAADAPATVPTKQSETSADPRAEVKRYVAAFGAENGAKWYGEGIEFSAAMELHAKALNAQLAERDAKIGELNTKLASVDRGEGSPVKFGDGEGGGTGGAPAKFSHLGDNLGRFAAGIKLPTAARPSDN